jgi:hypothetical protein
MTSDSGSKQPPAGSGQEHISRQILEHLISVRGEGDEWDFKETLGNLTETSVRVNLAKDALALSNLPGGGTLVIGVADDYSHVGLRDGDHIDTTAIRRAVEKYIDGEFTVVAAEHEIAEDDGGNPKRYGIVHFARRSAQPVLAAQDGQVTSDKSPVFRSGDILIRRGAASIRANSGDVRRLLTSSVVNEARVHAVNELWACVVEQRGLLFGVETVYDVLVDAEYHDVVTRPELRAMVGSMSQLEHATKVQDLQQRVNLVRPHLPEDLYVQFRLCSAFVGRIQMKVVRQIDANVLASWTDLDDGAPDVQLRQLASRLLSNDEIEAFWAGQATSLGTYRPLRPVIDATESGLLDSIRSVLSGLA